MKKTILPVLALVSLLMVGMLPTISNDAEGLWVQRTVRLDASDDSYIDQVLGDNNYGTNGYGYMDNPIAPNTEKRSLYKWSLSSLPSDATIAKAIMRFYIQGNPHNVTFCITVKRISQTWSESAVTWNTKPDVGTYSIIIECFHVHTSTDWFMEIDVTNTAEKWYDGTYDNYGVELRDTTQKGQIIPSFKEGNYDEADPVLIIEYEYWDCDLEDKDVEHDNDLDDLRRRLDQIDEGVIIVGENEPYVPPTREGLESDPSGYFFVDPFWTIFYSWYDSKSVGASMSFVACYDSGWSDYEALEDELYIAGSYTTLWLNSSGSEVLNTTDAYTYYKIPDANAGDAYTIETSGGNIKTDRYCRMKRVETFSWMVSEDKKDYVHTFALTNDLSIDWRNVLWVIAADPDTTMDQSTIVVTDTSTNTELDPGKNYEITPSCIRFQLSYHNQTVSESYKVEYSTFQEGSEYQEPRGIFHHDEASSATLNNRVFLFDSVSISNPNSIKCSVGTRISIDFSSVPGAINEIFVITADGSYLEQGPPLGSDWFSFYGLEIPSSSVVVVSVYVKVQGAALEAEDLRPIGLLMFTAFFILTVSALIGWIATKSDKKLHKWTDPARGATFLFGLLTAVGFVVAFWSYG